MRSTASILVNRSGHQATNRRPEVELPDGEVVEVLAFGGAGDPSAAQAGSSAKGDLLVFIGAADRLRSGAVGRLRSALETADMAFGDELRRGAPTRKPGWSPVLLLSHNVVGHPWLVPRERVAEVGGLRDEYGTAVEMDLLLRLSEAGCSGTRVPEVLVDSALATEPAEEDHRRVVEDACRRRGMDATVVGAGRAGVLRVTPRPREGRVTVIIPTRDRADLLRRCVESLESQTDYEDVEILIADNDSSEPEILQYLSQSPHRVIRCPGSFDYASINNRIAEQASGAFLLFLNNDTEVVASGWLRSMIGYASLPGIGAVGAWLLYLDGRVQHAGVLLRPGRYPNHLLRGVDERTFSHAYFGSVPCEVTAVTGACMLVRKDLFLGMGGFDRRFRLCFNDIDLCLRLRERGYGTIIDPAARLIHHESASREAILSPGEVILFRARWDHRFSTGDPYYHPALDIDRADFTESALASLLVGEKDLR